MNLKIDKTSRGFNLLVFEDHYRRTCQIQQSSLADEDAIWFGIEDASPQVLASRAEAIGVKTSEKTGWVDYPIPDEVLMHTRMHLTRGQVQELIPILQRFVDTGEVSA